MVECKVVSVVAEELVVIVGEAVEGTVVSME